MKPWYRSFLYLFTLPTDLLMLLLAVIVRVAWGSAWGFRQGVLVVDLAATSWPARTWWARWGGAALVHVVILNTVHPRFALEENVLPHELVHVQQHEAAAVAGFAVGLTVLYFAPRAGSIDLGQRSRYRLPRSHGRRRLARARSLSQESSRGCCLRSYGGATPRQWRLTGKIGYGVGHEPELGKEEDDGRS